MKTKPVCKAPAWRLWMLLLLCFPAAVLKAQFRPSSLPEVTYPPTTPSNPVSVTENTSCYSIGLINWPDAFVPVWLLVSSWDDPAKGGGIAWQCLESSSFVVLDKGYFSYPPGVQDINVGIIERIPDGIQVDVSYHLAGSGHFYDIYDWQMPSALGGPGGGLLLNTVKQLSDIPVYTRISMDSHKGYGTCIVWEDPARGINIIAGDRNDFGPVFNLSGSHGNTIPDVAFTHAGPLDLRVACYYDSHGYILVRQVGWYDIIPSGPLAAACPSGPPFSICPLTNNIEDSYFTKLCRHLHIDAPDHYDEPNWAYVYTDGYDIYNRVMNHHPGPPSQPSHNSIPATLNLTDGSHSPLKPIDRNGNDRPVIAWDADQNNGSAGYYIGWVTGHHDPMYNPFSAAYIAVQQHESGEVINPVFPYTYMGVINNPPFISPAPSLALSKQNDQSPRLYTVFSQHDGVDYMLRNKYVPWSIGTFRLATPEHTAVEIALYPTPFSDRIMLSIPSAVQDETMTLSITDVPGRVIGSYNGTGAGVEAYLNRSLSGQAAGSYFVSLAIPQIGYRKIFKAVKAE